MRAAEPWPSVTHTDAPAVGEPALGVGQRAGGVAAVALGAARRDDRGLLVVRHLVGGERADRPPQHAQLARPGPGRPRGCGRPRRRGRSGVAAAGGGRPGRLEELLAGGDQVGARVRTRSGSSSTTWVPAGQLRRAAAPCRRPGPGPGTPCPRPRCPRRSCRAARPARGASTASARGPLAHLVGEQQLAAGRRPQPVLGDLQGALVGDLEVADLLDVVAPELDPQRVLLGRREDVEDAAADGELAALLDQVDPGVGGGRQRSTTSSRSTSSPARSATGSSSPRPLTCGCSTERTGATTTWTGPCSASSASRVREPAQDGEPAADGVAARAEPLVRQRLPGRELDDGVRRRAGRAARRPGPRPRGRSR